MTSSISLPSPATHIISEPSSALGSMPMSGSVGNMVINVATTADTIIPWGVSPRERDLQLRAFWPTEHIFSSALFTTVAQYVAFIWSLEGPPKTVRLAQNMLDSSQFGQGWEQLMTPFLIDYFTQDNGAFLEVVRTDNNDARSPVVALNHLDAFRCIRTGNHEEPVIYIDAGGSWHRLKACNVIAFSEFPAPQQEARGIQYCALTRILRGAQIMRDISIVKQEKASGRFTRQVHLVSGVQTRIIEDAISQKQAAADSAGFIRYIQPLIIASLDPTSKVSKETIDLASIPEDYDEEKSLNSYILMLALAFGTDYQNFAPARGGASGPSGASSKVQNMKSRGKSPGLFMNKLARVFNFHGVLPRSVTFAFGEKDIAEQMELTELKKSRAEVAEIQIRAGIITTEVARQIAVDDGDLSIGYLMMMGEENTDNEITVPSDIPVADAVPAGPVKTGTPGPKEAPKATPAQAAVPRPENSNSKRPRAPINNQKRNPGGVPEAGASA